ncbi:helix-turn-helix domain-containing protein [Paenibacillus sp. YN15]|uniref:helix-turn-helix domain-containing protein n=1 Tax=Paenibacillus sp. YN15 TaxID=1742774 RepID=UPI000DCD5AF7|nr:helix-turn-helix domain-containing protein [Paenibacillus sp. YN15]RAU91591.1 hypothetical protein DQG13_29070 [Paenibacillus sp. YN15]
MRIRFPNYFVRLLMFCLLLGSIPVIVVGIISYYKSATLVQDKINESSMDALQQTQLRMEQILKTIDHSMTQYIGSPLVGTAMSLPYSAEHYEIYQQMYQSMVRSQTFELTISNMTVLNLNGKWGVDNNNIFTFEDVKNLDRLLQYEALLSFSAWVTEKGGNAPSTISLVKKIPLNSLKANGLAIVTITEAELSRLLLSGNRIGSILVIDSQYRTLSESSLGAAEYGQLVEALKERDGAEGQFNIALGGEDTSVIVRPSSYNGWKYVSVISIRDVTRDARSIGWVTLTACMLMILTTGGLALFGSRSFYQPVRKLVHTMGGHGESQKEEEPTRDEFDWIGRRLQSLLQTESRLSSQVNGQIRDLKQFFVLKLIRGEEKEEGLAAKLEEYGYPSDWQWHAALAIEIDSLEESRFEERDRDLLLFAIANIAGELIPVRERLDPVLMGQSQLTLAGGGAGTGGEAKARLADMAEGIQRAVRKYLDLPVSIGISRSRDNLIDAHVACEEALDALRYRIRTGPEAVIFIDEVRPGELASGSFPHRAAREFCEAVKQADRAQSEELLDRCLELIFREQADWRQYQLSLVKLYTLLTDLEQSETVFGLSMDSAEEAAISAGQEKQLFERLLELKSREEIRHWFLHTVMAPIMARLEQQRHSHAKQISARVIAMIHEGYDTELTLEACAAQLNYHPNHLGPLFSRETGTSFSEYLQQYRLQMAKQWLVETDMRIGEIAERLTYTNPQNFIRFFRKMEDMTPGQYREKYGRQ